MTCALKNLDIEFNIPSLDRYSLVKYRTVRIHHQLVSLLHNTIHIQVNIKSSEKLENI